MRVELVQSGGFAGLRIASVVDSKQLSSVEQHELSGALDRVGFFALPRRRVSGLPDVIQYRLSAELKGRKHEILFDAETADAMLTDLVERIVRLAERAAP
jgi:hypothetical protein